MAEELAKKTAEQKDQLANHSTEFLKVFREEVGKLLACLAAPACAVPDKYLAEVLLPVVGADVRPAAWPADGQGPP